MTNHRPSPLSRRAFLKDGTLVLAAAAITPSTLIAESTDKDLRVGLVTDLHYADKPPAGTRHYRETIDKLAGAASQFENDDLAMLVELGDFIDRASSVETELRYLKTINQDFSQICKDRHYVLGNHCVDTLHKQEFLDGVGQQKSYYSFDRGGFHFVILDSCFRSDGEPYGRKNFKWTDANIPQTEIDWLSSDLNSTDKKVIVFAHQRLDVNTHHGVKNNARVRSVLESSGKVLAVFQGHSHKNDLHDIGDIHYCTLRAMVEGSGPKSNGFCVMNVSPDGTIRLNGFHEQHDYHWNVS